MVGEGWATLITVGSAVNVIAVGGGSGVNTLVCVGAEVVGWGDWGVSAAATIVGVGASGLARVQPDSPKLTSKTPTQQTITIFFIVRALLVPLETLVKQPSTQFLGNRWQLRGSAQARMRSYHTITTYPCQMDFNR
jgi:hypothetical protein